MLPFRQLASGFKISHVHSSGFPFNWRQLVPTFWLSSLQIFEVFRISKKGNRKLKQNLFLFFKVFFSRHPSSSSARKLPPLASANESPFGPPSVANSLNDFWFAAIFIFYFCLVEEEGFCFKLGRWLGDGWAVGGKDSGAWHSRVRA